MMNDYRDGPSAGVAPADAPIDDAENADWDDANGQAAADPDFMVEERELRVDTAAHGLRLDKALAQWVPEFSRNHLQALIRRGCVKVDDHPQASPSHRVRSGSRVMVQLVPTAQSMAFRAEPLPLDIVFEDQHVLVINKAPGLVVHPAAGNWSGTLLNGLLAHHAHAAHLPRAGIVHRLDKDTSGLMVVGKSLEAVTGLSRAIAARDVKRAYLALIHGEWATREVCIEVPIGRDPRTRTRMAVLAGGKSARTDVCAWNLPDSVTDAWAGAANANVQLSAVGGGVSRVICRLHTGRTHQIRVHMAHQGFPLLGDELYGGRPGLGMARQALHAWRLEFQHPVEGELLQFEAEPPTDFVAAWRAATENTN
jgi:23S rRNA pseudouridine1911/1915/1917 synthase